MELDEVKEAGFRLKIQVVSGKPVLCIALSDMLDSQNDTSSDS